MPPKGKSGAVQVGALHDIRGENRSAQAEIRLVSEPNGLVFVLDPEKERDRPKEFLSEGRVVRLDIRKDRRLHEGARTIDPLATHHERGAMGDGSLHLIQQLHQGASRGERSERRRLVHRVARNKGLQGSLELGKEPVRQLFDDDESLRRHAALSGIIHLAPDRPLHRFVEIGILQHHEGIGASQLHGRLLEVLPG
jgi:hypothetical protein